MIVELSVLALVGTDRVEFLASSSCDPKTNSGVCTVRSGGIERTFRGQLVRRAGTLIWRAEIEDAVAAIVASESAPNAPPAALEAQAIAARTFLSSGRRHRGFDFCDTTHCQHFKEPTAAAVEAARRTRGLILTWQGRPFPAAYSASCGGRTRTAKEVGWRDDAGYPFYAVDCVICQRDEQEWSRQLPPNTSPSTESERLRIGRVAGWAALPSNNFRVENGLAIGRGRGHGVGLCQLGAAGLARQGYSAARILAHYYPATVISAASLF